MQRLQRQGLIGSDCARIFDQWEGLHRLSPLMRARLLSTNFHHRGSLRSVAVRKVHETASAMYSTTAKVQRVLIREVEERWVGPVPAVLSSNKVSHLAVIVGEEASVGRS